MANDISPDIKNDITKENVWNLSLLGIIFFTLFTLMLVVFLLI
jgi:hypothetical protein